MTQLSLKVDNAQIVRQGLQNLDAEIPQVGRLPIYRTAQAIQQAMKKRGAKPTHPINWVSARQRKAFFASDGFRGGIPHKRSDHYINSWKVERIGDMGYRVINQSEDASFVGGNAYGQGQSPIHRGRWPLFRDTADKETIKLPDAIRKEISVVARRNGF